jgi:hypothetical protein
MIDTLISCDKMRAYELISTNFLAFCLQRFTGASILHPISVVLNCTFGDIRQGVIGGPAMGEIFKRMLVETHAFVKAFIPSIEFKEVNRWV